jgi:hypothetical protein
MDALETGFISEVHHSRIPRNPKWFKDFADRYKLKVEKDCCGDPVIYGMYGHLSVYYTTRTKLVCVALDRASTPTIKRKLLRAQPDLVLQECDFEVITAVDWSNDKYLKLAIKLLGIPKIKSRRISEAERKRRSEQAKSWGSEARSFQTSSLS